jgi:O-antigen/teichoic acid export membrane protein
VHDDPLARTSGILIADNVVLGGIGALCTVLATHYWAPQDVGAVAAAVGALNLLVVASLLGMPTTIVRFLGSEPRQSTLMKQALIATSAVGGLGALTVSLVPGHFGIPLGDLDLPGWLLPMLAVLYAVASIVVAVGDPAYTARQEASFVLGKDIAASILRLGLLLALAGTGVATLFLVALAYVTFAATIDLALLAARLKRQPAERRDPPFSLLRRHFSFALGSQAAVIIASVTLILPTAIAAFLGTASAAYIAVDLQVASLLTIIPAMTGQSLLAELSRGAGDTIAVTTRALRGAYMVTIPCASALIVFAPYVLLVFGSRYASHGSSTLRWCAAASPLFVFSYVSDFVLLASRKVRAYVLVNFLGTVLGAAAMVGALTIGFGWIGPAFFFGATGYAVISAVVLSRFLVKGQLRQAVALFVRPRHG